MEQSYKTKEITCSSNPSRKIFVYDDIFDFSTRTHIYEMGTKSFFRIIGSDNGMLEYRDHISIVSTYTSHDLKASGIVQKLPQEVIDRHNLKLEFADDTMINLSMPSDRFHAHVDNDSNGWTMVYYMNMEWRPEWGGDTAFMTEDGNDLEHVVGYKPGRIVFFHPQIPHMIRPSTIQAPYFRLTLATKFIPFDLGQ